MTFLPYFYIMESAAAESFFKLRAASPLDPASFTIRLRGKEIA